jgi:hypothetical protein
MRRSMRERSFFIGIPRKVEISTVVTPMDGLEALFP